MTLRAQTLEHVWPVFTSTALPCVVLVHLVYGSIFPALRRLQAQGWVRVCWAMRANNRRARLYELTAAGRKQLATARAQWERFSHALI